MRILKGLLAAFSDEKIRALLGILGTMILSASLFYQWAEGWRFLDALYFSVITISTVGFGDFSPQTDAGKIFTIFYILCGLGLFVSVASAIAERIKWKSSEKFDKPRYKDDR